MNPHQPKSDEWLTQWTMFSDEERFLFEEWIAPATIENFRGKDVLECGCGGGQHTRIVAEVAASVTAVDLNTAELARQRNSGMTNVTFVDADLAAMDLGRQFDVVFCIGVIHHTDDPDRTFANISHHLKPGGRIIVWTYSAEGNALVRWLVEPARKLILRRFPRPWLVRLAEIITVILYLPVYTVYQIPAFKALPYWEYFSNFRRLGFRRNVLNVFDKLNAPQTHFTTRAMAERWLAAESFEAEGRTIRPYVGVSWTLTGIKRAQTR